MSEPARLAGVYFEPGKAFADIAARPRWWPPVVLLVVAGLAMMYCFTQRVGWERAIRQGIESNTGTASMPVEQREAAVQRAIGIYRVGGYAIPIVVTPVIMLLVAAILMFVFNTVFAAGVPFPRAFAVTAYAMLPGLITAVLAIVVMYLKSPDDFDIQNPLAFNLGAFLGADSAKWLKTLLTSFDLFTLWTIALLAIGFAAAAKKRLAWSRALTAVVACWLVWVVLKTGGTALFS